LGQLDSVLIFFFLGFGSLFIYNPQTLKAVNNVTSITSFNLRGMSGSWLVAYFIYMPIGLLNITFVLGLFKMTKNNLPIVIGKILILMAGLIWTSFGVMSWEQSSDNDALSMWVRLSSMLIITSVGLIIIGIEFKKIANDNFLQYYTMTTGLGILLVGILGLFVLDGTTLVIRANISLTFYFVWFGVFGLRLMQKASAQKRV
jgi:preprotein translocase subunit Sss1